MSARVHLCAFPLLPVLRAFPRLCALSLGTPSLSLISLQQNPEPYVFASLSPSDRQDAYPSSSFLFAFLQLLCLLQEDLGGPLLLRGVWA